MKLTSKSSGDIDNIGCDDGGEDSALFQYSNKRDDDDRGGLARVMHHRQQQQQPQQHRYVSPSKLLPPNNYNNNNIINNEHIVEDEDDDDISIDSRLFDLASPSGDDSHAADHSVSIATNTTATNNKEFITQNSNNRWTSHDDDVDWSILSNAFFVAGGLVYIIGTSWDYAIYNNNESGGNNVDIDTELVLDLHTILSTSQYIVYQSIWVLGPTIYFANAVIDVKWALIVRNRDARRRHLKKLLLDVPNIIDNDDDNDNGVDTINGTGKKKKKKRSTTRSRLKAAAIILRPKVLLNRMRRHIGHRRQLSAATTFGMGAFLGILAAVCNILVTDSSLGENEDVGSTLSYWSSSLESASIHMYLVSAIFALWQSPWATKRASVVVAASTGLPWYSNVENLETLGDVFFGAASMIDVLLCDVSIDDGILLLPILSACLWTVDALLYLRGDFAMLYQHQIMS